MSNIRQLIESIERGDIESTRHLLAQRADPNEITGTGWESTSPLIAAAISDHCGAEMIQTLLEAGADVRLKSGFFHTSALWWASGRKGSAKRHALLDGGADPFESASNGRSVLVEVARADDVTTFDRLIAMGLDPFPQTNKYDFQIPFFAAVEAGAVSIVLRYLELGADPNARTLNHSPVLSLTGSPIVAKALVKAGADLEALDEQGNSLLVRALGFWHSEEAMLAFVRALLDLGADVNAVGPDGTSPLMHSVRGREALVSLLLDYGADPLFISPSWGSRMHSVVDEFYKDRPYDIGDLRPAIRLLRERGVQLDGVDEKGMTPLHWAAATGDIPAVRAFLAEGANVHARASNSFYGTQQTALMLAIHWAEALDLLLAAGSDPHATDADGLTALGLARNALTENDEPMKTRSIQPHDPRFPRMEARFLARQSEARERLLQAIAVLEKQ